MASPSILVIYLLGFGVPSLPLGRAALAGVLGVAGLRPVLLSAYVAEVYRARIESVHQAGVGRARSGLCRVADSALRGGAAGRFVR